MNVIFFEDRDYFEINILSVNNKQISVADSFRKNYDDSYYLSRRKEKKEEKSLDVRTK